MEYEQRRSKKYWTTSYKILCEKIQVEEEKEKNERIYKKIKELKNNVKNLFKEISDSDFQD